MWSLASAPSAALLSRQDQHQLGSHRLPRFTHATPLCAGGSNKGPLQRPASPVLEEMLESPVTVSRPVTASTDRKFTPRRHALNMGTPTHRISKHCAVGTPMPGLGSVSTSVHDCVSPGPVAQEQAAAWDLDAKPAVPGSPACMPPAARIADVLDMHSACNPVVLLQHEAAMAEHTHKQTQLAPACSRPGDSCCVGHDFDVLKASLEHRQPAAAEPWSDQSLAMASTPCQPQKAAMSGIAARLPHTGTALNTSHT